MFLSAFIPLCSSGLVEMSFRWAGGSCDGLGAAGAGCYLGSPHPFVSLGPFVGVQMSFYHLSQQLTQSIILASNYIFPSTLSYLLSVLEPLTLQIHFYFLMIFFLDGTAPFTRRSLIFFPFAPHRITHPFCPSLSSDTLKQVLCCL